MTKLRELTGKGEIYHFQLLAEANQIGAIMNDDESNERLDAFLAYIEDDPIEKFIVDQSMSISFAKDQKPFCTIGEVTKTNCYIKSIRVTQNFFEIFQVQGYFNRRKIEETFKHYTFGDDIPVVLGADFKKYFDTGDTIMDDMEQIYQVVGFLNKGEFYVAPYESSKAFYLDDTFVIPTGASERNFITLASTCFRTDDITSLAAIEKKSNDMRLFPLRSEGFTTKIETNKKAILNEMMTILAVMSLIFLFASIGVVSYMIRFIQNR
ncbi:MAG: hypothetical protein LBU57_01365, partial [Dysgonamonadaceae bacterium]|nr:hypothetical protein [Dysgonamonadaceae bacterium]